MLILKKLFRPRCHYMRTSEKGLHSTGLLPTLDRKECNLIIVRESPPLIAAGGGLLPSVATSKSSALLRAVLVPKSRIVHTIEIETSQFKEVKLLRRTFEIRKNNDYKVGDVINYLEIREGKLTGYNALFSIIYITEDEQKEDFRVMNIVPYREIPRLVNI